jgi:ribosomal protein S10
MIVLIYIKKIKLIKKLFYFKKHFINKKFIIMFICIRVLSKNRNSFKNFLKTFNKFYNVKQIKKKLYIKQKKLVILKKYKNSFVEGDKKKLVSKKSLSLHRRKKKYNIYEKKKVKINGFLKYIQQKHNRCFFTILKSPHIYKTAQEQIEYRRFSKQIIIFSFQILKYIILLKKIQTKLFPDIEIQIKFLVNNIIIKKKKLTVINPNNYTTKNYIKNASIYNSIINKTWQDINSNTKEKCSSINFLDIDTSIKLQLIRKHLMKLKMFKIRKKILNRSIIGILSRIKKNQIINYIKLFDCFGELSFKTILISYDTLSLKI